MLLCEQEVVADDTKAIDSVLKADKKRSALLAEEKTLMEQVSTGGREITDRLRDVSCLFFFGRGGGGGGGCYYIDYHWLSPVPRCLPQIRALL